MFDAIDTSPLPASAFLRRHAEDGDYTDCYATRLPIESSLPDYVEAFYTTALFKAERFLLKWLASLPSTDEDARQLARGRRREFAAWLVEDRGEDQLLLYDIRKRTGSWFMCRPHGSGSVLYFGSVVFRTEETKRGRSMKSTYRLMLGFHRLYSRALLSATRSRLLRRHGQSKD
ncbi:MAG: hypothetical protein R3288_11815 [Woeseiaceae bacterium]|nr:hypothetical protein [Woeseiaceae bacterium]